MDTKKEDNFCEHCSAYTGKYCRESYCEGAFNGFDGSDGKKPGTGYAESNEDYNIRKDKWSWMHELLCPGNCAYSDKYLLNFKDDAQVEKLTEILKYYQSFYTKDDTQYIGINKLLTKLQNKSYEISDVDWRIMWFVLFLEETYYMGLYPKNDRFQKLKEIEDLKAVYSNATLLSETNN